MSIRLHAQDLACFSDLIQIADRRLKRYQLAMQGSEAIGGLHLVDIC